MVSNLYPRQMEITWYPVACKFLKLDHHHIISIPLTRKASLWKELYNISKIEPSALMTIFHAEKGSEKVKHVQNLFNLFDHYNREVIS